MIHIFIFINGRNVQNIFIGFNILMIFGTKIYHFDRYNVFLAIATNIPMLLFTGFVVQGHFYSTFIFKIGQVVQVSCVGKCP